MKKRTTGQLVALPTRANKMLGPCIYAWPANKWVKHKLVKRGYESYDCPLTQNTVMMKQIR